MAARAARPPRGSQSERHAAMARMRERRGGGRPSSGRVDDDDWAPSRDSKSTRHDDDWAPSRDSKSTRHQIREEETFEFDLDVPPPAPRCPAPPRGFEVDEPPPVPRCPVPPTGPRMCAESSARQFSRGREGATGGLDGASGRSVGRPGTGGLGSTTPGGIGATIARGVTSASDGGWGFASDFKSSRTGGSDESPRRNLKDRVEEPSSRSSGRVRGPTEARASRGDGGGVADLTGGKGDDVPPGAAGADFKTLQQMIARGIQESETVSRHIEKGEIDESEIRRHAEEQRRRREEEAAQRQKERDIARQKRKKEDEERRRRQNEELERQEVQERQARQEREREESELRQESAAATRIQARVRGRRSRAGKPVAPLPPATSAALAPPPHHRGIGSTGMQINNSAGRAEEDDLLC